MVVATEMGISWSTSAQKLQTEDSEEDLEREIGLGGDELSEMMVPGQL